MYNNGNTTFNRGRGTFTRFQAPRQLPGQAYAGSTTNVPQVQSNRIKRQVLAMHEIQVKIGKMERELHALDEKLAAIQEEIKKCQAQPVDLMRQEQELTTRAASLIKSLEQAASALENETDELMELCAETFDFDLPEDEEGPETPKMEREDTVSFHDFEGPIQDD